MAVNCEYQLTICSKPGNSKYIPKVTTLKYYLIDCIYQREVINHLTI